MMVAGSDLDEDIGILSTARARSAVIILIFIITVATEHDHEFFSVVFKRCLVLRLHMINLCLLE